MLYATQHGVLWNLSSLFKTIRYLCWYLYVQKGFYAKSIRRLSSILRESIILYSKSFLVEPRMVFFLNNHMHQAFLLYINDAWSIWMMFTLTFCVFYWPLHIYTWVKDQLIMFHPAMLFLWSRVIPFFHYQNIRMDACYSFWRQLR